jgi:hypothetical protein
MKSYLIIFLLCFMASAQLQGGSFQQGGGGKGIQGPKGDKGDRGDSGRVGTQGIQGPQGSQGLQGTPGIQGVQGSPGSAGAKGDKGDQGNQGLSGTNGTNGTSPTVGMSGDQITVNSVITGPHLTGPQGAQGNTGTAGSQGLQGIQGIQGIQGNIGNTGSAGPNQVTTSTTTNITGIIKGNGSVCSQASAGSDFVATNDSRLTDSRIASDVSAWAKAAVKPSYVYSEVGADVSGAAAACTTGLGTALAGKSATSHTHTTLDTCNIRAGKVLKLDSLNVLAGARVKKLVIGAGTLMLDSLEIKDGTTDTLIIGAFGKKWKFLPIASQ